MKPNPRLAVLCAVVACATLRALDLSTATIADLQSAMNAGTLTSERLTQLYIERIEMYDKQGPTINTVIVANPKALETARMLDAERKAGKVRSPIHGIPIVLKDNYDTYDLPTTAGSQLLEGSIPPDDAYVVKKLRDAGAVILANPKALEEARALDAERKTKGPRSPLHGVPIVVKDVYDTVDMPTTGGYLPLKGVKPTKDAFVVRKLREAGAIILAKLNQSDWYAQPDNVAASTLGGNTLNPYDLTRIPGWSSAGTSAAIAAVFAGAGLGSETGFSVRTPTSDCNLYGLSSTSGLISRDGQMWSYITGERCGPLARSMYDLCATLDIIAGFDSFDLWTAQSLGKMPDKPYVSFLDPKGLRGARVGVLKEGWDFKSPPPDPEVVAMAKKAIGVFGNNGAKVIDPVSLGIDLPQFLTANGFPSRYERIHAVNHYLARQGPGYPFKNAAELLLNHPGVPGRPADKQAIEHPIDLNHDPEYRATLEGKAQMRAAVIALMDKYGLDALIYPHKLSKPLKLGHREDPERKYDANQLSPLTGLPAMIVPMGFTSDGNPVGLEILGRPWSEPTLIKLASGYEAVAGDVRKLPPTTPALPGETITY